MSKFTEYLSEDQNELLSDYFKSLVTTNEDERVVVFDEEEYDRV